MTRRKLGCAARRRDRRRRRSLRRRLRRRQGEGFKTRSSLDAHPVMAGVRDHAAPDRRRRARRAGSSLRVDSGRDLAVRTRGQGRVDLFVNHETSKVPFPLPPATRRPPAESQNDFDNAQVSQSDPRPALGRGARTARSSSRAARATSGSARTTSPRRRRGSSATSSSRTRSRPTTSSGRRTRGRHRSATARPEEAGLVVALDVQNGNARPDLRDGPAQPREQRRRSRATRSSSCSRVTTRSRAGRSPTAAAAPIRQPGRRSRSSTRTSRRTRTSLLADEGELWAFVSTTPGVTNYYDVLPDPTTSSPGSFIEVPRGHRHGPQRRRHRAQGRRHRLPAAADERQLAARPRGRRRRSASTGRSGCSSTGARLNNVFDFVRVEDIAYDKRAGHGERRLHRRLRARPTAARASTRRSGRRTAGSGRWCSTRTTRQIVTSLTVLVEGDDNPVKTLDRDPPAGQPRVDAERDPRHRGSRLEPAVPSRLTAAERDDGTALVGPVLGDDRRSS